MIILYPLHRPFCSCSSGGEGNLHVRALDDAPYTRVATWLHGTKVQCPRMVGKYAQHLMLLIARTSCTGTHSHHKGRPWVDTAWKLYNSLPWLEKSVDPMKTLLPHHSWQILHCILVTVKTDVQVGDTVSSLEARKDTGIVDSIGSEGVHNLKIHLEWPSSLIPSQLQPDLVWWNYAIMPGQSTLPERFILCVCIYLYNVCVVWFI